MIMILTLNHVGINDIGMEASRGCIGAAISHTLSTTTECNVGTCMYLIRSLARGARSWRSLVVFVVS